MPPFKSARWSIFWNKSSLNVLFCSLCVYVLKYHNVCHGHYIVKTIKSNYLSQPVLFIIHSFHCQCFTKTFWDKVGKNQIDVLYFVKIGVLKTRSHNHEHSVAKWRIFNEVGYHEDWFSIFSPLWPRYLIHSVLEEKLILHHSFGKFSLDLLKVPWAWALTNDIMTEKDDSSQW